MNKSDSQLTRGRLQVENDIQDGRVACGHAQHRLFLRVSNTS